ncbi:S8 family serine peptidase [Vibrio coralliilyticus]|uniref:S8 family serine peptidase n=1 Tax=Vibrio coralliilyticus TaxID=190893 RepID=UPI00155FD765|nr:S8 family serine peptidase [Vibrio coralliilyticus]NRF23858.1 S8 family serine peptidase [Vibrio coralliilyticus]NRF78344.1 S8 family serine peptidase [Vibrio coralliilyticus]
MRIKSRIALSVLSTALYFPAHADMNDTYIVVLKDIAAQNNSPHTKVKDIAQQIIDESPTREALNSAKSKGQISRSFENLKSFSATLTEKQADQLKKHPKVKGVYKNVTFTSDTVTQAQFSSTPSWGLDRSDQRNLPLDGTYDVGQYTGKGVSIYIVDSGIDLSHSDFGGRAVSGWDFVDNDGDASDCSGHGTHVAGTAAGNRFGIAPEADIYSVRVLDCESDGDGEKILNAFNWIIDHAKQQNKPAVINYSISRGSRWEAMDTAVDEIVQVHNISFVHSAGNRNKDACIKSPHSDYSVTVGASTNDDYRKDDSSWGNCVSLFAPGFEITSAANGGGAEVRGGTSMATPHVTGHIARLLQMYPQATTEEIKQTLINQTTENALFDVGPGSPNRLLYTRLESNNTNTAPIAQAIISHTEINQSGYIDLDGAQSYDPNGDTLSYRWQVVSPSSHDVVITEQYSVSTRAYIPETTQDTRYTFELTANDGKLIDTTQVHVDYVAANESSCEVWSTTKTYDLPGNFVSWKGKFWENYWWTRGDEPGTGDEWDVWREVQASACK